MAPTAEFQGCSCERFDTRRHSRPALEESTSYSAGRPGCSAACPSVTRKRVMNPSDATKKRMHLCISQGGPFSLDLGPGSGRSLVLALAWQAGMPRKRAACPCPSSSALLTLRWALLACQASSRLASASVPGPAQWRSRRPSSASVRASRQHPTINSTLNRERHTLLKYRGTVLLSMLTGVIGTVGIFDSNFAISNH